MSRIGYPPPTACRIDADEVHISVAFTWDLGLARDMYESWSRQGYRGVKIGGPAVGFSGGDFTPGMYVKEGCTITSRGCPNRCKVNDTEYCDVPKREGPLRLLEIKPGYNILDNNLLACPREHVEAVLDMLASQKKAARFTGGIEARRCEQWFVDRVTALKLDVLYLAYDRPQQKRRVERAAKMLLAAGGWSPGTARRRIGCYVLAGYDGDSEDSARRRFEWVMSLGITPFPMFYKHPRIEKDARVEEMKRQLRRYMRPSSIWKDQSQETSATSAASAAKE